jgi:hypothetical protein
MFTFSNSWNMEHQECKDGESQWKMLM